MQSHCSRLSGSLVIATEYCIYICICTWQRSDEVSLQHGFEVGVDVAVLVVAHTGDQALNELHLVSLRPLIKQNDAVFLLLFIISP